MVAFCGQPELEQEQADCLLNPQLLAEVLRRTTQGYDRLEKLRHYRKIPSLRACYLISQTSVYIENLERMEGDRWERTSFSSHDDSVRITCFDCVLQVADVYDRVDSLDRAARPASE